jgi:hypothetical protein
MPSETVQRAERIMSRIEPELAPRFGLVFAFLEANPALAQKGGGLEFGTEAYIQKYARSFVTCRNPAGPRCPETAPDPMVALIMELSFGLTQQDSVVAVAHHNFAMGAENIIGNLLERYIAETLEPHGWVWCSGSLVKAVDFVKPKGGGGWIALQVKNRDNSENSSSAAIREGTEILKWFRTFSRRPATNWDQFPHDVAVGLSETGFQNFVKTYLQQL